MKKYISLLTIILTIISCDIEETPYVADYESYVNPDKKVLIEDFTGHLCPNCPGAAREMKAIHDIYGDQIIGIAIHVTKAFAKPYSPSESPKFQYDFRTKWGGEWDNYFEISAAGLPRGMINRTSYPENHKMGKGEWSTAVANELKKPIDFKLSILSDSSSISITTEIVNTVENNFNLVVCLTENNIINWQKDGAIEDSVYEHNHVLRSVLNTAYGESISDLSTLTKGEVLIKKINIDLTLLEQNNINYSLNIAEEGNGNAGGWNKNNLSVIAYIYNTITKEIVQVEESHLLN